MKKYNIKLNEYNRDAWMITVELYLVKTVDNAGNTRDSDNLPAVAFKSITGE